MLVLLNSYRGVFEGVRVDSSDVPFEFRVLGAVCNSFHRFQDEAATGLGVVHRGLPERGGDELRHDRAQADSNTAWSTLPVE